MFTTDLTNCQRLQRHCMHIKIHVSHNGTPKIPIIPCMIKMCNHVHPFSLSKVSPRLSLGVKKPIKHLSRIRPTLDPEKCYEGLRTEGLTHQLLGKRAQGKAILRLVPAMGVFSMHIQRAIHWRWVDIPSCNQGDNGAGTSSHAPSSRLHHVDLI